MSYQESFCPLSPFPITCRKHGQFFETPLRHLLGYGCPVCDAENPEALGEKLHNAYEKLVSD